MRTVRIAAPTWWEKKEIERFEEMIEELEEDGDYEADLVHENTYEIPFKDELDLFKMASLLGTKGFYYEGYTINFYNS